MTTRKSSGRYGRTDAGEDRVRPARRAAPAGSGDVRPEAARDETARPQRRPRGEPSQPPPAARRPLSLPPITAEIQVPDFHLIRSDAESDRPILLFLTGERIGTVVSLDRLPLTIGRDPLVELVVPDEAISRRHARLARAPDGILLEDLGSRNGTVVNGERVDRRVLADGDRIMLGRTVLKFAIQGRLEEDYQQRVYELSTRDGLTNLHNRRFFDERLATEVAFARRHGTLLGILMLDIDHFKRVNDTHGHLAGDHVLVEVARTVATRVRAEDVVARYGGEEIVVLVRDIPPQGVEVLAERLRAAVEALRVPHAGRSLGVTVSIGALVARPGRDTDPAALVAAADRLLYEAKAAGRNRVRVAAD